MSNENDAAWWGSYRVPMESVLRWRIGPLTLRIHRVPDEWRVATDHENEALDCSLSIAEKETGTDLRDAEELTRISDKDAVETIELSPRLADRPVVTRPDLPFIIPPMREATLFVSTPLWLLVRTSLGVELLETPLRRPSDTWFGPNTREGELCYASVTACRLRLSDVVKQPHRAVTPVCIANKADTPLKLERLNIPVKHLSLFAAARGHLWTQDLTLERMQDESLSPATLGKGPPASAGPVKHIAAPREEPPSKMMVRAFSSIFG